MSLTGLSDEEVRNNLPSFFMHELGDVISVHGLLSLVTKFGGENLYIPHTASPDGKFAGLLSPNDYEALCARCGGNVLKVPMAAKLKKLKRDKEIVAMKKAGASHLSIAKKFGIRDRTVYRILREMERNGYSIS